MKKKEFIIYESIKQALPGWWLIVFLMILGGISGWIFHLFIPPVYEARAVITISMDFDKRELTQREQDIAFNSAEAISTSSEVMSAVIAEAQANGYSIDLPYIKTHFFVERMLSVWELRVRYRDPKVAADLANIWSEKVTSALKSALDHAMQADQLQLEIDGLNSCITGASGQDPTNQYNCDGYSQEEIQIMLQDRMEKLAIEKESSLGIISIMTIGLTGSASLPEKPVIYGLGSLVLAGACIGLVISLWVIYIRKVMHHD